MTKLLQNLMTFFWPPRFATVVAFMLQSVEYQAWKYLRWFWTVNDFTRVMRRRTLDKTRAARLVQMFVIAGVVGQSIWGIATIYTGFKLKRDGLPWFGLACVLIAPVVWAHIVALAVGLGRVLVGRSRETRAAAEAARKFQAHPGVRVAIAGSYGKTSMKELLWTVLSEGKKVAATPGNMNVVSSHAQFARSLAGDEDVVLVEFGEGKPGDVALFSRIVRPEYGVITGVAPAHLDQYKTLQAAAADIFSLAQVVPAGKLYVNTDSSESAARVGAGMAAYSARGTLGWKVQKVATDLQGTTFELVRGKKRLKVKSGLVGKHQVGALAFAVVFALQLGLSEKQALAGAAKSAPYPHRMQPYPLNGAWIIDDTYNGNLEGIQAGCALLKSLKAKRKVYVTPGLVDQGKHTAIIHRQVGEYIASAKPDVAVLMQNSVTRYIQAGLIDAGFKGEVLVQDDPLDFYQNLDSFVAKGDVVLMQNDWTDNYR